MAKKLIKSLQINVLKISFILQYYLNLIGLGYIKS